jgi:DNA-binding response OmpR family regulator
MRPKHILIAEDDLAMQTSLSFILEDEGYQLTTVSDGKTAFEKIQTSFQSDQRIDLLITDIQMPKLNGLQLIKSISRAGIDLPVIVITGYGDKQTLIELIRLGCDDFLAKPFEPDEVCKKIQEVLKKIEVSKTEEEKRYEALIKQNIDLAREINSYKSRFSSLKKDLNNAIITYNDLICFRKEGYRVSIAYRIQALKDLGGDFIDIRDTRQGCDIIIADVAGHDIAASYHTVMIKSFFDENCRTQKTGDTFFQLLNHSLLENGKNERMVTSIFLRVDLEKYQVSAVSAAHPQFIYYDSQKNSLNQIDIAGNFLGLFSDVSFETKNIVIHPKDRLILYTDGIPNAFYVDGLTGKKYTLKTNGLLNLLQANIHLPIDDMVATVWNEIEKFSRFKQTDDMLLFALEIPKTLKIFKGNQYVNKLSR